MTAPTAIGWMAIASALNFGAYEFIRSATMALFTSDLFESSSSVTMATGLISPASLILLYVHRKIYAHVGPRRALLFSSVMYVAVVGLSAVVLRYSDPSSQRMVCQFAIVVLFISKSAFVHLLYAQHSSFMMSLLRSPSFDDGVSRWSPMIAGIASVVSTCAGWLVAPIVRFLDRGSIGNGSMTDLLLIASCVQVTALFFSDQAHQSAERSCSDPQIKPPERGSSSSKAQTENMGVLQRAGLLFRAAPVLEALCVEVLICQAVSALLSCTFVSYTKEAMPSNEARALFTGTAYARINFGSGVLQFFVLPFLLPRLGESKRVLWLAMPTIISLPSAWMALRPTHDGDKLALHVMTTLFCTIKTLEYSLRSVLDETVYETLDDESAAFGKEIVALFANRLGKSATSLVLAGLAAAFSPFTPMATGLLAFLCGTWLVAAYAILRLLKAPKQKVS